ncbi:MAG: hypothetical protein AB7V25_02550 [Mangrovibacterium sp.]|jgi:hypothetical protein
MENLPDIKTGNVRLYLDNEEIVIETIQQISKDFGMFGIDLNFRGSIEQAYAELHGQLTAHVQSLLTSQSELLMSILYQVDISQRDLNRTRIFFPDYSEVEVIAHEIIFRDLRKVLFRRYFKSNS